MSHQVPRVAVASALEIDHADAEAPLVVDALRRAGAEADLYSWNAAVDWAAHDLVVVRSPWDYFDHLEEFLAWVDSVEETTRIVNPAKVIRWNSHKGYLAEMGARGVPVLPTLMLRRGTADVRDRLRSCGWTDVVVKPAVDGGARGALRTDPGVPEAAEHAARLAETGDVVVQPYAPQIERGEVSLLFFGGELSHAVRKVPARGDYRVQAYLGGAEHRHEPTEAELATARQAMEHAPGRLTYARVDLLEIDGVPTLMELEVIEPDLFFRLDGGAVDRFAHAVLDELP